MTGLDVILSRTEKLIDPFERFSEAYRQFLRIPNRHTHIAFVKALHAIPTSMEFESEKCSTTDHWNTKNTNTTIDSKSYLVRTYSNDGSQYTFNADTELYIARDSPRMNVCFRIMRHIEGANSVIVIRELRFPCMSSDSPAIGTWEQLTDSIYRTIPMEASDVPRHIYDCVNNIAEVPERELYQIKM